MGYGSWSRDTYTNYAKSIGRKTTADGGIDGDYSAQEMFKSRRLDAALNPHHVMRECCDSEEHPHTRPVILALDVTGSMGTASVEIAKRLNPIMTKLFAEVPDIEFMTMAIGDLSYDSTPIQMSQFESDIRIAEQLDKVYFEGGGGGNGYESYTAAWYMALHHTKMDCLKRGYKPLIITMGDEPLNPMLPRGALNSVTGDCNEANIETKALYERASELFDIHHIGIGKSFHVYESAIKATWGKLLDERYHVANLDSLEATITGIILDKYRSESIDADTDASPVATTNDKGEIKW